MAERIYLNDGWKFSDKFSSEMICENYDDNLMKNIRIPHTVKETPLHYFDEHEYQMVSSYRRKLYIPNEFKGRILLITFEGIAHGAEIYINEKLICEHHCGYTAFTTEISDFVNYGETNTLFIKVDSRENQNIPPFGFVIDYMTYGGIYRDVFLEIKEHSYISDLFLTTQQANRFSREDMPHVTCCKRSKVTTRIQIVNAKSGMKLRHWMREINSPFQLVESTSIHNPSETGITEQKDDLFTGKIELWDIDHPSLYEWKTELVKDGIVIDSKSVIYGYRKAVFKKDGFFLNGKKVKICGLNRHQSFPYVGYAMPESMQKLDADILKKELGLNAVRTSHYPQSQYFIDRCDQLGLLVFTEIPGWQHIGDEEWKDQAVQNTKEMIIQYRNHPSIILWGVRINESIDDDIFYERTNSIARELDPSRPTGGVRCFKHSHLLEDVYTYNDFIHSGSNKGCDKKSSVTSNIEKPYLVSEYGGHMFPTKSYDCEEHRLEHALRHARVLNDIEAQSNIAGSFGWCMTDYNTHRDFGSGDRICYHGVMDMFRNPKLAAFVYSTRQDDLPVLRVSSSMDIGEHPGGNLGNNYIFTNADSVRMYKNDHLLKEYSNENSSFPALRRPPILIDDYIGDLLETREQMPHIKAVEIKSFLNEIAPFGMNNPPKTVLIKAAKIMITYHMSLDDIVQLYNRYIGDWGGTATQYRFDAVKNGHIVKSIIKSPMTKRQLSIMVDHTNLVEKHSYDVAAVRISVTDEFGNILPFYNEPVTLEAKEEIQLVGPSIISLSGGMGGTYIKSSGKAGSGILKVSTSDCSEIIHFSVSLTNI